MYIIPIESILKQIKTAFKADAVRLPRGSTPILQSPANEIGFNPVIEPHGPEILTVASLVSQNAVVETPQPPM
jgi:hypothetical protein